MYGTITSYIINDRSGYGFIHGEDGKDYRFDMRDVPSTELLHIAEDAPVAFDPVATPRGYAARDIKFYKIDGGVRYVAPDEPIVTRNLAVKGWEVLDDTSWWIIGTSRNSPEDAKARMRFLAKCSTATGLV